MTTFNETLAQMNAWANAGEALATGPAGPTGATGPNITYAVGDGLSGTMVDVDKVPAGYTLVEP
jgi:hypothetical protein